MFKKFFKVIENVCSVLFSQDKTLNNEQQTQKNFSLEEKSKQLDDFSRLERENRIFLSRVLNANDVMALRREEELKRKEANCRFSREKWKYLKRKKFQKELSLYLKSQKQRNH